MPIQRAQHHLVTVWNPSYAADAMEQHLGLLLHLAGEYDKKAIGDEQLYVWWGKVRSPNRQGPQANAEDIRRIAKELDAGERDEVQLYLTDYQSLYVGDVDLIREGGPGDGESAHMPAYYGQEQLAFDFSFPPSRHPAPRDARHARGDRGAQGAPERALQRPSGVALRRDGGFAAHRHAP